MALQVHQAPAGVRMPTPDTDALVIGAGPAGGSVAIRLARLGWRVTLIEQVCFPRQKVCGECLGPASLELLDELGLGPELRALVGPPIRQVAWMAGKRTIVAEMPACPGDRHAHGCAIGRDCLDMLLLARARSQGVLIVQPAKVRKILGSAGDFECVYERRDSVSRSEHRLKAALVIDAHGSWERAPADETTAQLAGPELQPHPADLLAFKTTFEGTSLPGGLLPVLCLPGGYGGMVVADRGRTTVACCIQRQTLRQWRVDLRGAPAGEVIEHYLRSGCAGVAAALRSAQRQDAWQAVGPLRTGLRARSPRGLVRIGNAGAEAHPLIGEGICMALQSAAILAGLCAVRPKELDPAYLVDVQRAHAAACRKQFSGRLRLAALYAHIAMQPSLAAGAALLMRISPRLLTAGAQLAGKARRAPPVPSPQRQAIA